MNRRYKITGTPTVIVNGKYVTDVGMAGSEDKLFEVINALAAKDKPKG
jgi:thiol:disulfide interchange protein DsbA